MEGEIETVVQAEIAASDAVATASEIASAEASETIAAVIDAASEQIEEAQQMAAQIAASAMETELGRQIAATNERISSWLDGEGRDLRQTVTQMQETLRQLSETVAATATLTISSQVSEQSIPLISEQPLTEAVEAVTEVLPETIAPAPVENTPAEPAKRRRKVFL